MSSIFTKVKKFLGKHADELGKVTDVLGVVVSALPLDPQDKRRARDVLATLDKSAENIAAAAARMTNEALTVNAEQVSAAVDKYLKSDAGKKQIAAAIKAAANQKPATFGS